ncbi:MAG: DNA translocase FtsK 4TM domain-containing protein, partial [Bacteroidaceae bacterium]|nr:DNA translocase FtsK 4TM domain-containing protein [Bacteroidaceae bacterium]
MKKQHKNSPATSKKKGQPDDDLMEEEAVTAREVVSFTYVLAIALMAIIAVVMLVSYTSCLISGHEWEKENMLGTLGIWVARTTFDSTFGLGSYMVPVFLLATVARLSHLGRVRLWKWFINCALLMVWISVFAAFLQQFETFTGAIVL